MKNYGNSQNVGSDNRRCMLSAGRGDRYGMDPGYPGTGERRDAYLSERYRTVCCTTIAA